MYTIIRHPLIDVKLSRLRDENTINKDFREYINEIASFMCFEMFKDLKTITKGEYYTPTGVKMEKVRLEKQIVIVPILRAGIGFCDGILKMIPDARIGHIGMYRDEETLQPQEYYFKLPNVENPTLVIVDPMLATGGSAIAAIDACKKRGYKDIRFMCLVACPEGMDALENAHPDVPIYTAAMDECLNENGYIMPGLGDAGDRIFGTK